MDCRQVGLEIFRNPVARAICIKRWIGDRDVEGVRETYPGIADCAYVRPKLERVLSVNPGNIIREVVNRSHSRLRVCLAVRLEHEAETDVIPDTVTAYPEHL